jgi:anti-anti-sigma regulatory factor
MPSSMGDEAAGLGPEASAELELLSALGFGSDSALMQEPKLFVDGLFLGALLAELEDELGATDSARVLFQIGMLHGLRDAGRLGSDVAPSGQEAAGAPIPAATLLAMGLSHPGTKCQDGAIDLRGSWPEAHEAEARLTRLGPGEEPGCALSAGYTSGWLSGTLEADVFVVEQTCRSRGDEHCSFRAADLSHWHEKANGHDPLRLLPALPYERLRKINRGRLSKVIRCDEVGRIDPEADVVHIWGPVMVLPFTDIEEALLTVEALGSDPATAEVRAVVVDLRRMEFTDDLALAALEQVLETIEAWGAEALLTGVAPLYESLVSDIEATHVLVRKDLAEAVAAAFQIAEAQRHLL